MRRSICDEAISSGKGVSPLVVVITSSLNHHVSDVIGVCKRTRRIQLLNATATLITTVHEVLDDEVLHDRHQILGMVYVRMADDHGEEGPVKIRK